MPPYLCCHTRQDCLRCLCSSTGSWACQQGPERIHHEGVHAPMSHDAVCIREVAGGPIVPHQLISYGINPLAQKVKEGLNHTRRAHSRDAIAKTVYIVWMPLQHCTYIVPFEAGARLHECCEVCTHANARRYLSRRASPTTSAYCGAFCQGEDHGI